MKYFFLFILLFYQTLAKAQNLVPNPSFELYNNCPDNFSEIAYSPTYDSFPTVKDWVNPTRNGSPDYYNGCAADFTFVSVPLNGPFAIAYQTAKTGKAYVGMYTYDFYYATHLSEYVECKLLKPLIEGHKYAVSYFSSRSNWSSFGVDKMGAELSDTLIYVDTSGLDPYQSYNIPLKPDIESPAGQFINTDSTQWTRVGGIYTAKGGEQWLTVGRFVDGGSYNYKVGNPFGSPIGYAYIDDVSVIDLYDSANYNADNTSSSSICANSFPLHLTGSRPGTIYEWNTGDTSATITVNDTGTYWRLTGSDSLHFVDTIKVFSTPAPPPPVDTTICQHTIHASISVKGSNIKWYLNPDSLGSNTQPAINTTFAGVQTLYVSQSRNMCESGKSAVTIYTPTTPEPELKDTSLCRGNTIRIGEPHYGINYKWNTGDTICCININTSGVYVLEQSNACGIVKDSMRFQALPCDSCLWVPSAFTPNNDGRNDIFRVIQRCPLVYFHIEIANRWGQIVFKTNDISRGWDGMFNGVPSDIGNYAYFIQFIPYFRGALEMVIKGNVTVVR